MKRAGWAQTVAAQRADNKDTAWAAASEVAIVLEGVKRGAWRIGLRSVRPACQRRSSYPINGSGLVGSHNPASALLVHVARDLHNLVPGLPLHSICWPEPAGAARLSSTRGRPGCLQFLPAPPAGHALGMSMHNTMSVTVCMLAFQQRCGAFSLFRQLRTLFSPGRASPCGC